MKSRPNSGQFPKGGPQGPGRGPEKGNGGRPPNEFALRCAHLTETVVLNKVTAYLAKDDIEPNDAAWRWCAEYVTEYSKGKPVPIMQAEETDEPVVYGLRILSAKAS